MLPKILQGKAYPVVTRCIVSEMRNLGDDYRGSVALAKRLRHVECSHKSPVSSHECILSLTQKTEYCVATVDENLLKATMSLPHVPVLLYDMNVLVLRRPTKMTKHQVGNELERRKKARHDEIELVKQVIEEEKKYQSEQNIKKTNYALHNVSKHKKAKGPNPLSVKKKKLKPQPQQELKGEEKKKKRTRKRKASDMEQSEDVEGQDKVEKQNEGETQEVSQKAKRKRKRRKNKDVNSCEE